MGTGTIVSLPYTPTQSGMLHARGTASTNKAYILIDNGYYKAFTLVVDSGWTVYCNILVIKGKQISQSNSNVTGATYTFYPFTR